MGDKVEVVVAEPGRFEELAVLFGPNGAYAGCWCMWPRLTGSEFGRHSGDGTRRMLRDLVEHGHRPGLIARVGSEPAGWVAVAPRPEYGRMLRSPLLRPHLADDGRGAADDDGVWSVTCLFVGRDHRGRGLADRLLVAARDHAHADGAHTVEGYPIDPRDRSSADELFHGTPAMFHRAGFVEVARTSPRRTLWRHTPDAISATDAPSDPRS